jgi:hypothetical protein
MLKRVIAMGALTVAVLLPRTIVRLRGLPERSARSSTPLFRFLDGDKVGFIDASGKIALPAQYLYDTGDFIEGLAKVRTNGMRGFIDPTGRMVIQAGAEDPSDFSNGLARVSSSKGEGYGYIDKTGSLVIPFRFHNAEDFSEGLAAIWDPANGNQLRAGYIDTRGKVVIPPAFGLAGSFQESVVRVAEAKDPKKQGFIDTTGRFVIPPRFTAATDFQAGLAAVQEGGRWGFVNHAGIYVIKQRFEEAKPFSEGLAAVKLHGRWGYIDRSGALMVAPVYALAESFSDGLALVSRARTRGYINKSGSWVLTAPSTITTSFSFGLANARLGKGHFSYFNKTGRIVFEYYGVDDTDAAGDLAPELTPPPALKMQSPGS